MALEYFAYGQLEIRDNLRDYTLVFTAIIPPVNEGCSLQIHDVNGSAHGVNQPVLLDPATGVQRTFQLPVYLACSQRQHLYHQVGRTFAASL